MFQLLCQHINNKYCIIIIIIIIIIIKVPVHAMKAYGGRGLIPHIINVGTRWN
jgi:hypothetical protein